MQELRPSEKPVGLPPSSSTGTPAPYGHACKNCAKAKCKCIYTQDGNDCERCSRLNKQCQPSVTTRRRNPRKSQQSKTAHLEEKLDDLVSLIRSQAAKNANIGFHDADNTVNTTRSVPQSAVSLTASDSSPQGGSQMHSTVGGASTDKTTPAADTPLPEYAYTLPADDKSAEERLAFFRRHMLSYGPCAYIPTTMTAQEVQRTRPFLWLGIVACTSSSMRQSYAVGDKMRAIMANKLVLSTERGLDLLQGLLVYLIWPQSHRKDKPFIMTFTNLGVTLAQDLGYTAVKGETAFMYSKKFWGQARPQQPVERTMEERRAVLSLYLWHIMISHILRLDNRLRWTPFMEESLRMLQQQPEWEGDVILATQLRCGLVTQQLTEVVVSIAISEEKQIPLYLHRALLSQVDDIWRTLPASIAQNDTILLQLHATEANIHELALAIEPATAPVDVVKRLGVLQQCCKALQNWFDIFERIPSGRYVGLTFTIYVQLLTSIIILVRLTSPSLRDTSAPPKTWDPSEIRKQFDLVAMLDRIGQNFDAAIVAMGIQDDEPNEESIWRKSARSMRAIMKNVQEENANANNTTPVPNSTVPVAPNPIPDQQSAGLHPLPPGLHDPFMTNSFNDDPWLISSFFVPWDSMNF